VIALKIYRYNLSERSQIKKRDIEREMQRQREMKWDSEKLRLIERRHIESEGNREQDRESNRHK